jgi:phage replication initiation protein
MVADWTTFDRVLRANLVDAQFKRVDLALDYLDGSLTFERAEAAWDVGGFDPLRGPRPARNRVGYPETGRTFYVGKRATSDRFFRVYDKGLEQGRHLLGDAFEPRLWVRAEVECKPCNGPVPLDIIANRDAFFAGASPFFADLLSECGSRRRAVRDPVADSACTVADAVRNLRRSAGPALAALLEVYGSAEALVAVLTAGALPSGKLIEAGARLLTREDMAALGL